MELACKIYTYFYCGKPVYVHFILHLLSNSNYKTLYINHLFCGVGLLHISPIFGTNGKILICKFNTSAFCLANFCLSITYI